jgi:hypothetical protein
MAKEFTIPSTPGLTKIVDATMTGKYGSYEEMKTALRNSLGMASPSTETMSMPPTQQTAQQAVSAMPDAAPGEPHDIRVLYLHGNSRFEIEGTQAQLDAQEAALRAMYGSQQ